LFAKFKDYTLSSKMENSNKLNRVNSCKEFYSYPIKKSLIYDADEDFNEDNLSEASFSLKTDGNLYHSNLIQSKNNNNNNNTYCQEYLNSAAYEHSCVTQKASTHPVPALNSAMSIMKF
jgi:hypothetical protein